MSEITVRHKGIINVIQAGKAQSLQVILRDNGHDVYSPCGGNGTCGKCRLMVKGVGYVSSCMFFPETDIEVILPEEREARILTSQYAYTCKVPFDPGMAVHRSSYPLGMAVDLGTTTVVCYMADLVTGVFPETRSFLNPQSRYGSDVISRIHYGMSHSDGRARLQTEIIERLNREILHFTGRIGVPPEEMIKITVTGNTTMLHLFLGEDPAGIALAPFKPAFLDKQVRKAGELGLACNPDALIETMPVLSGYVGADIIAGLASLQPPDDIRNYLFIDIGTNGEMALVTPERILCCSAAAGPAFEGGNIACGMGGVHGAIAAYSESGFDVIGDAPPAGICGSGLLDVVAFLLRKGIIDNDGFMEENFILWQGEKKEKKIFISPKDVREVQLAKSAVAAGINIMMQKAGLDANSMDAVFLAGGFGNYLNPDSASAIGLLPRGLEGKIIPVGNTSGTGASLALKSEYFVNRIFRTREIMEYTELSNDENFPLEFAMNMAFGD